MFDEELEAFKSRIDLRAYAAGQGYQLDKRESWSSSAVMRHPDGDKIIIQRAASDGHYVYFSVRRDDDNGSIVDFVQNRQRVSLGVVRKELRPWLGAPPVPVPALPPLTKTSKDRLRVEAEFAKTRDASRHPYLETERAIPGWVLESARFSGRIRIDQPHGNAVFPHIDTEGICGFEIRNTGFKGFSPGGCKALWLSQEFENDSRLVFCEGAIDALSYAVLHPDDRTRYASIGGKPSPLQLELIRAAVARMPASAEIVSAMDSDTEGTNLADIIRNAVQHSGRDDLHFTLQEPFGFKDWNDRLRADAHKCKPALPYRLEEPSVA